MKRRQTTAHGNQRSQHSFAQIPSVKVPRSSFNRSHNLKTTFDAGQLVPIFIDEALPGDTMKLNTSTFARMATPLHPVMDNLHMDIFYFAVPLRIIWDNFKEFMGEEVSGPGTKIERQIPQVDSVSGWAEGSLADYFGLPLHRANLKTSALFFRAYNAVYNEWFRDQNLVGLAPLPTDDGPDDPISYIIRKRAKRHDYFTSALPWPQKGEDVTIPLGDTAPLAGYADIASYLDWEPLFQTDNDATGYVLKLQGTGDNPIGEGNVDLPNTNADVGDLVQWNYPKLTANMAQPAPGFPAPYADLSQATAQTINVLREAFQLQRLYEKDARGGTRYTEIVRSHFGVISPDARQQRPEYLGGAYAPLTVNPVPQTAEGTEPLASLGAFVTSSNTGRGFIKSFTEHSIILGLACVRADLNYQEGINRMHSRLTRYDFYWPSFAHLGEQELKNKELHCGDDLDERELTFGYQERYAEYRYKPSLITGRMRSSATSSLDTWHLAQDFGNTVPALNETFITEDPPMTRVIAVTSEPQFILDAFFQYNCIRPMPVYSVPGLIDHF